MTAIIIELLLSWLLLKYTLGKNLNVLNWYPNTKILRLMGFGFALAFLSFPPLPQHLFIGRKPLPI